jgi:hypothetical protein
VEKKIEKKSSNGLIRYFNFQLRHKNKRAHSHGREQQQTTRALKSENQPKNQQKNQENVVNERDQDEARAQGVRGRD